MSVVRWLSVALMGLVSAACSDEGATPVAPSTQGSGGSSPVVSTASSGGCDAGMVEGSTGCVVAGLRPVTCSAGSHEVDGSCVPAGAATACADGFEIDPAGGCAAIRPDAPCGSGTMALLGEITCAPVASCGTGAWGDIARDASTVHVDAAYAGGDGDGSEAKPFPTIAEGVAAAPDGGHVAVAAGSYPGNVTIAGKTLTVEGRCPSLVEIVATGSTALNVRAGADDSVVRGMAITGDISWGAVAIAGSTGVVLDRIWLHDTEGARGIDVVEADEGPTSAIIRHSLIERTRSISIMVWGASVTVEHTEVRSTSGVNVGRGITVGNSEVTGAPSSAVIRDSIFYDLFGQAIGVFGSTATIERTLVSATGLGPDGGSSQGIYVGRTPENPTTVTIRGSRVEDTQGLGIYGLGADLTIETTTVARSLPMIDGRDGWGVAMTTFEQPDTRGALRLHATTVVDSHEVGLLVDGSDLEARGVEVRRVEPNGSGKFGPGVVVADSLVTGSSTATLVGMVIEDTVDSGVSFFGSSGSLVDSVVRGTISGPLDARHGIALQAVHSLNGGTPVLSLEGVLAEDNEGGGARLFSAEVDIAFSRFEGPEEAHETATHGIAAAKGSLSGEPTRLAVRGTELLHCSQAAVLLESGNAILEGVRIDGVRSLDGLHGDGVAVLGSDSSATITTSVLANVERAGASSFGAQVALAGSLFDCNAIDLNGEEAGGTSFAFDDLGGNTCGCQASSGVCQVLTTSLEPPAAPPQLDGLGEGMP